MDEESLCRKLRRNGREKEEKREREELWARWEVTVLVGEEKETKKTNYRTANVC